MPQRKKFTGLINLVAMLLSIPIIGTGIWLASEADNACVRLIQWPVMVIGILVLAVALAGFIGEFWRNSCLVIFYMVAMVVLIVLLAVLIVLVFLVTNNGAGHPVPGRVYLEYSLDDYSGWLRQQVEGSSKWDGIKNCLASTSFCAQMNYTFPSPEIFFNAPISPLQSGCCKPPTMCGYNCVNPTNWINPINTAADVDCVQWSNDQSQLCFSCNSCKAGLLANLMREWRKADLILLFTFIALICVYVLGCCCFRRSKTEEIVRKYEQGYT